jgi:NADP-dependent 3-hydroxy acid dehydrogenase YdfG
VSDKDQRTAIITGAGRGIGAACAETFTGAGWNVVLVDRDADELSAAAEACGGRPAMLVGDVARREINDEAVAIAHSRGHPEA